jgi:hypothetical protein
MFLRSLLSVFFCFFVISSKKSFCSTRLNLNKIKQSLNIFYNKDYIRTLSFEDCVSVFKTHKYKEAAKQFITSLKYFTNDSSVGNKEDYFLQLLVVYYFPLDSLREQSKERVELNKVSKKSVELLDEMQRFLQNNSHIDFFDNEAIEIFREKCLKILLNIQKVTKLLSFIIEREKIDIVENMLIMHQRFMLHFQSLYLSNYFFDEFYFTQQKELMKIERDILTMGGAEQKQHIALVPLERFFQFKQGRAVFYNKLHNKFAALGSSLVRGDYTEELEHIRFYFRKIIKESEENPIHLWQIFIYFREKIKSIKPLNEEVCREIDSILSDEVLCEVSIDPKGKFGSVVLKYCIYKLESWGSGDIKHEINECLGTKDMLENILMILVKQICKLGCDFQDFIISSYSRKDALKYEKSVLNKRISKFEINFEAMSKHVARFTKEYINETNCYQGLYSSSASEAFVIDIVSDLFIDTEKVRHIDSNHMFFASMDYITKLSVQISMHVQHVRFLIAVTSIFDKYGLGLDDEKCRELANWITKNLTHEDYFTKINSTVCNKLLELLRGSPYCSENTALCINKVICNILDKKDGVYFAMLKRSGTSLNFYLRKGYVKGSFLRGKELFFKEGLEKVFSNILDISVYFHDIYTELISSMLKDKTLSLLFVNLVEKNIFFTDAQEATGNIEVINQKIYNYAMLAQGVVFVRRAISAKSLFLDKVTVKDERIKEFLSENIKAELFDLDKKEFIDKIGLVLIDLYNFLDTDNSCTQDEYNNFDYCENDIKKRLLKLDKNPGTKFFYKYLFTSFKEALLHKKEIELSDVSLVHFYKDIRGTQARLAKILLVYLREQGEMEGLCRRYDFLRAGFRQ